MQYPSGPVCKMRTQSSALSAVSLSSPSNCIETNVFHHLSLALVLHCPCPCTASFPFVAFTDLLALPSLAFLLSTVLPFLFCAADA